MKISIIIPVFNESAGIELLLRRLEEVTTRLAAHEWEL